MDLTRIEDIKNIGFLQNQMIVFSLSDESQLIKRILKEKRKEDLLDNFGLSPREKKVYSFLETGLTRTEIACQMNISENTVRNFISRMLKKLDVKNTKIAILKINDLI